MPRIRKIRVSNIHYAEDTKRIPDIVIDAQKDNLLFVLANGGGKSLMLQLILQCVLPNSRMNTRRVSDMLSNAKFSGHVAVEWLLDGEQENYLLTGFCFTNPANDQQQIDYFSYTNIYQEQNLCDLENLPLLHNQTPISFANLKKYLLDAKQPRLQIFYTQKSYKNYLSQFHIYEEEWESMRVTNSEEGGVSKYFSNCKTTTQLLENIALPTIERALFENQNEKDILASSFKKHYADMLQIPVLQKNIEDYGKIYELSEPLIKYVGLYNEYKTQQEINQKKVVGLHFYLKKNIVHSKERMDELDKEKIHIEESLKNFQWKIQSAVYFENILQKENLNEELRSLENKLKETQKTLTELKEEGLKLKAFELYSDIENQKKECQRIEMLIEQLSQQSPQLQKQLSSALNEFLYVWREYYSQLQKEKNKQIEKSDFLKHQSKCMEQNLIDTTKTEKELIQQKASLNNWLENFEKQRENFAQNFSPEEVDNPQLAAERLNVENSHLENLNENLKLKINQFNVTLKELQTKTETLITQEAENSALQKNLQQKLKIFEAEHENLLGQLSLHKIINIPDVLLHQNTIQLRLHTLIGKEKEELSFISGQCANIKSKLAYVNENNYFVPHPILISIKNHLESVGIVVILGTEWLRSQTQFNDTEKQALVKKNPLLPFSFLAEQEQIKSIEKELLCLENWEGDFPLVCLARTPENLTIESSITTQNNLLTILNSQSLHTAWNEQAFVAWKESLHKKQKEFLTQEKEHQSHYEFLLKLDSKLNEFYKIYSEKNVQHWKSELFDVQKTLENLQQIKNELRQLKQAITEDLKNSQEKINDIVKEKSQIQFQMREVIQYDQSFSLKEEKNQKHNKVILEMEEIDKIKNDLQAKLKQSLDQFYECKEQIKEIETKSVDLDKIKLKYLNGKNILAEKNSQSYSLLLNKIETLNESLNSQQQDMAEISKSLEKSLLYLKKDESQLAELFRLSHRLNLDFLIQNTRNVHEIEKSDIQNNILNIEKEILNLTQKKEHLSISFYKIQGILEQIKKNIALNYNNQDPYEEYKKENYKIMLASFEKENKILENKISEFIETKNIIFNAIQNSQKAVDWIEIEISADYLISLDYPWAESELDKINTDPLKFSQSHLKILSENKLALEKQNQLILKIFQEFLEQLRKCKNNNLVDFIRETENVLGEQRLLDFDYVSKTFSQINDSVKNLKEQSLYRLEQLELNRRQIVERIAGRMKEIYKDLFDIARNTKITLYEKPLHLIKIEGPTWQEEDSKNCVSAHLNTLIQEIYVQESEGKNEEEINQFIDNRMTSRYLLNKIIGMEKIKISVFKPRQEAMFKENKIDYLRWDEVERWSGGEKFCAYMSLFLALTSYLRGRTSGSTSSWRVLLADNPFGIASSKHILDPVFTMASLNKIQLICFTAHSVDEILKRFSSVYSLKLVPAFGREHMRYEKIERGFYSAP